MAFLNLLRIEEALRLEWIHLSVDTEREQITYTLDFRKTAQVGGLKPFPHTPNPVPGRVCGVRHMLKWIEKNRSGNGYMFRQITPNGHLSTNQLVHIFSSYIVCTRNWSISHELRLTVRVASNEDEAHFFAVVQKKFDRDRREPRHLRYTQLSPWRRPVLLVTSRLADHSNHELGWVVGGVERPDGIPLPHRIFGSRHRKKGSVHGPHGTIQSLQRLRTVMCLWEFYRFNQCSIYLIKSSIV